MPASYSGLWFDRTDLLKMHGLLKRKNGGLVVRSSPNVSRPGKTAWERIPASKRPNHGGRVT